MIAGELVALLRTVTLPTAVPAAVGENATMSGVICFGVRSVPAVTPLGLNPIPTGVTLEIVTFEFPLFVSVVLREALLPTFTFPKPKFVGLAPSRRVVATPV